jgi:hypothetical protein
METRNRRFMFRSFVGPCAVVSTAHKVRQAGVRVTIEGPEHIYFVGDGPDPWVAMHGVMEAVYRRHQTVFGLRPEIVRTL